MVASQLISLVDTYFRLGRPPSSTLHTAKRGQADSQYYTHYLTKISYPYLIFGTFDLLRYFMDRSWFRVQNTHHLFSHKYRTHFSTFWWLTSISLHEWPTRSRGKKRWSSEVSRSFKVGRPGDMGKRDLPRAKILKGVYDRKKKITSYEVDTKNCAI